MPVIKHTNKFIVILFSLIIILIISLILINYHNSDIKYKSPDNISQTCINSHCFNVSLAITEQERKRGLMFVKELRDDEGMLFIFQEEAIHPFWMKNTLIPLDMIWINSSLDIVDIFNASPCKDNEICNNIIPNVSSLYTLEINSELSDKYNFSLGDKVVFHNV